MADVTRAMEKAQEAVARITSQCAAVPAETESYDLCTLGPVEKVF